MIGVYELLDGIMLALFYFSAMTITLALGGWLMDYAITHSRRLCRFLERLFKTNLI